MKKVQKKTDLDKKLDTIKWCVGWILFVIFLAFGGSFMTLGFDSDKTITCISLGGGCVDSAD
jgi:hypothetical protein